MHVTWYNDFENVTFIFQDVVGGKGVAKFQIEPLQYLNIYRVNATNTCIHLE